MNPNSKCYLMKIFNPTVLWFLLVGICSGVATYLVHESNQDNRLYKIEYKLEFERKFYQDNYKLWLKQKPLNLTENND